MKSSVLSLVLVAGLAAAQSSKLPTCASKCISEYTTGGKIAGCGSIDVACICKNKDFLSGISCCLQDACDTAGQEAAIEYAGQICSTAGVTVPNKLSCSSSSSSSKSGSSESATKSASGSAATPESTATGTGKAASASASGSSTGTSTGSSASSTSSGSAAAGTYSAGGLLGAVAAMLFAL